MEAEIPGWDFNLIKKESAAKWEKELSKIEVETINENDKKTFYTAMYHTMIPPVLYQDVDGKYLDIDQNIHNAKHFTTTRYFHFGTRIVRCIRFTILFSPKETMISSSLCFLIPNTAFTNRYQFGVITRMKTGA